MFTYKDYNGGYARKQRKKTTLAGGRIKSGGDLLSYRYNDIAAFKQRSFTRGASDPRL